MSTVSTSDRAFSTLQEMSSKIESTEGEILQLLQKGKYLVEDQQWTGSKANEFRGVWSQTDANLRKALNDLRTLRGQVQRINQNIAEAGGGLG